MNARSPTCSLLLVVPCYRESSRIGGFLPGLCEEIGKLGDDQARILVVDDGSELEEKARLRLLLENWRLRHRNLLPLMDLPVNLGKGGAVYAAWRRHAADSQWLGFVDADGSCPAGEAARLFVLAIRNPGAACIASRMKVMNRKVKRHPLRQMLGRLYSRLASFLLDISVQDTQCGLKIVPSAAFNRIEPLLTVNGFAFDAQLICALLDSGCPVMEEPIDWHETPGGKIRLLRDSLRMMRELLAIRSQRFSQNWITAVAAARNPPAPHA